MNNKNFNCEYNDYAIMTPEIMDKLAKSYYQNLNLKQNQCINKIDDKQENKKFNQDNFYHNETEFKNNNSSNGKTELQNNDYDNSETELLNNKFDNKTGFQNNKFNNLKNIEFNENSPKFNNDVLIYSIKFLNAIETLYSYSKRKSKKTNYDKFMSIYNSCKNFCNCLNNQNLKVGTKIKFERVRTPIHALYIAIINLSKILLNTTFNPNLHKQGLIILNQLTEYLN